MIHFIVIVYTCGIIELILHFH